MFSLGFISFFAVYLKKNIMGKGKKSTTREPEITRDCFRLFK